MSFEGNLSFCFYNKLRSINNQDVAKEIISFWIDLVMNCSDMEIKDIIKKLKHAKKINKDFLAILDEEII
jgi:hypothetical protein